MPDVDEHAFLMVFSDGNKSYGSVGERPSWLSSNPMEGMKE